MCGCQFLLASVPPIDLTAQLMKKLSTSIRSRSLFFLYEVVVRCHVPAQIGLAFGSPVAGILSVDHIHQADNWEPPLGISSDDPDGGVV